MPKFTSQGVFDRKFFDRKFQVWEYQVSMGNLLIRSPRSDEMPTNLDLHFTGVDYLCLPRNFDGLALDVPTAGEIQMVEKAVGARLDHRLWILVSGGNRFAVAGSQLFIRENDWEHFDSPIEFRSHYRPKSEVSSDAAAASLEQLASAPDFDAAAARLVSGWRNAWADLAILEVVLRFMETHRELSFDRVKPFLPLIEDFMGRGYDQKLFESIQRAPVPATVQLLCRLIDLPAPPFVRDKYIRVLLGVRQNPHCDDVTLGLVNGFVAEIGR